MNLLAITKNFLSKYEVGQYSPHLVGGSGERTRLETDAMVV